ncbi:MAG: hypothetical protein RJA77_858 [Pseudomonadota bacterium]
MLPFKPAELRVALVHDWLTAAGGAERVLARMLQVFPQAEIFTLFGDSRALPDRWRHKAAHTSWLSVLPGLHRYYRVLAPLMPAAVESLHLAGYDLVISSSWAFAHGAKVDRAAGARHLAYVHSPMRWAWDMQEDYLDQASLRGPLRRIAQWQLGRLRDWDLGAAQRPDLLLANSRFIQSRIRRCWSRDSELLFPPVELPGPRYQVEAAASGPDHYLSVCRLVAYKRVDLIVKAFAHLPNRRLLIAGDGPERQRLEAMATPNVRFVGWVSDDEVKSLMRGARGFIQASREDFGISVVEAQGCGIPVIAYGQGGARETVNGPESARPSGLFFQTLEPEALASTILEFERQSFDPEDCRAKARTFSPERFDEGLMESVQKLMLNTSRTVHAPIPPASSQSIS